MVDGHRAEFHDPAGNTATFTDTGWSDLDDTDLFIIRFTPTTCAVGSSADHS